MHTKCVFVCVAQKIRTQSLCSTENTHKFCANLFESEELSSISVHKLYISMYALKMSTLMALMVMKNKISHEL